MTYAKLNSAENWNSFKNTQSSSAKNPKATHFLYIHKDSELYKHILPFKHFDK